MTQGAEKKCINSFLRGGKEDTALTKHKLKRTAYYTNDHLKKKELMEMKTSDNEIQQ